MYSTSSIVHHRENIFGYLFVLGRSIALVNNEIKNLATPSISYEMGDLISSSPISLGRAFNLEEVLKSSYVSARQI